MASKNLVLKNATWNGVESVDFPVSGGGTARYIETSDATAVASDIAQNKTAYVNGSLITGTATPTVPNIQALSVTQNGTYTASGGVDGYSPVAVSVSGGVSNYVSGKFTVPNNTDTVQTISIPYSGSGYPVLVVIVPEEGAYNTNSPIFQVTQQYAIIMATVAKAVPSDAPYYSAIGTPDQTLLSVVYKGNSNTNTSTTRNNGAATYSQVDPTNTTANFIRISDATTIKYYVASTSYGLMAGIEYRYHVIYSS